MRPPQAPLVKPQVEWNIRNSSTGMNEKDSESILLSKKRLLRWSWLAKLPYVLVSLLLLITRNRLVLGTCLQEVGTRNLPTEKSSLALELSC